MKKILLILLLIMPSMVMIADGPKYKFLSSHSGRNAVWGEQTPESYSGKSGRTANAGSRAVNYNDVFRAEAPATGRSLVSSEISISSEEGTTHAVSETGSASGITLGGRGESVSANHGSVITAAFSKKGPNTITLGNGKLALDGNAITGPDAGTCQPPASYRSPLGDAMVPLLLLALAFAAFKFKKN